MIKILFDIQELPQRNEHKHIQGSITKRSVSSYKISKGSKYYCCCRTYEQAYYVKNKLNECGWDKSKLNEILEEYPIFYTKLLELYRYITKRDDFWALSIPSTKSDNGLLQHITSHNLEALLYERDFLINHNWDYELLVECIDDRDNPYYDVVLPPYPERKIRNNRIRKAHKEEFLWFQKLLLENPCRTQSEIAQITGINEMNIRNWLHTYDMNWFDFRKLVLSGEKDLFKVMKLKPIIFKPDLSPTIHNFKGYIHKNKDSKKYPYKIVYKGKMYGCYPTKKLAKQIRDDLKNENWDKSKLKKIQQKYGFIPYQSKRNIHKTENGNFIIRKVINGKSYSYGVYQDYKLAKQIRDELELNNWDKSKLKQIREKYEN